MYLKELVTIALGLLLILLVAGNVVWLHLTASSKVGENYAKTSLSVTKKRVLSSELPFFAQRSFEYAIYGTLREGGVPEPEEFVKKIKGRFNLCFRFFSQQYAQKISIEPKIVRLGLGNYSIMNVSFKTKFSGENLFSESSSDVFLKTDLRPVLLYAKAFMFYNHAFKTKPIPCLKWDGSTLTITLHSHDEKKYKVKAYWNLTEARAESFTNAHIEREEETLRETATCELENGEECSISMKINGRDFVVWCSLIPGNEPTGFLPFYLEKNKPFELCIKTLGVNLTEKIRENVGKILPKYAKGETDCSCAVTPNAGWALARESGCGWDWEHCFCDGSKMKKCFKERIKNVIKNVLAPYIEKENDENTEWSFDVKVNSFSYEGKEGENCPARWKEVCKIISCGNNGGGSLAPKGRKTETVIPKYLFARYFETPVNLSFSYSPLLKNDFRDSKKLSCHKHKSSSCPKGCRCRVRRLYEYAYTYAYSYSFEIGITIKDRKVQIILAENKEV